MEQEIVNPELYENLVDSMGRKLFKWEGLYKTWSSDDPRSFIKSEEDKTDSRTTEQMIEDALVNVPEVPEDDVSKVIGEMNDLGTKTNDDDNMKYNEDKILKELLILEKHIMNIIV